MKHAIKLFAGLPCLLPLIPAHGQISPPRRTLYTMVAGVPTPVLSTGAAVAGVAPSPILATCQLANGTPAECIFSGGGGPTTFDQIGSGTNTSHGLVVGNGSVLTTAGTGFINANELGGTALATLPTGPLCNTTGTGAATACSSPQLAAALNISPSTTLAPAVTTTNCVGNANATVSSTGSALNCGPAIIYAKQVFGDSFDAGTGPQIVGQAHTNLLGNMVASILPFDNRAVVATTTPTIVNTIFSGMQPSPTYPSFFQNDGGNNDYGADTCGKVAGTNCVKNYQLSYEAGMSYELIPPQFRQYASQATQAPASSWAANGYALQLYDGSTNTVAQTAMQTSTSGAALTFAYPAANSGTVDLYYLATSGATATFTVTPSTTGTPITDTRCTGTTSFGNGGCNGQAPLTSAPQRVSVSVTAGSAGTITVTNTSANLLVFVAEKWFPSVWPANTNYAVYENSGALFDLAASGGIYSAAALASYNTVMAQAGAAGPAHFKFSDIRTVLSGLTGGGAPASNTPVGGPAVAGAGAGGHPSVYAQQAMMITDAAALADTGIIHPGAGAMDTGNSGNIYSPLQVYAAMPSNLGNTEANAYNVMNARNTTGAATVFCGQNVGVNCGIRTAGAGVTKPDGTTTAYMGLFGTTSSYADVCFEPYVSTFFATPTNATPKSCVKLATGNWISPFYYTTPATVVASAATIATAATVFHVSGTAAISTMTPPTGIGTGNTTVVLIADGLWSMTPGATTGQFKNALTAVVGTQYYCTYDGTLWYCK